MVIWMKYVVESIRWEDKKKIKKAGPANNTSSRVKGQKEEVKDEISALGNFAK
jgi:hypothetical protein